MVKATAVCGVSAGRSRCGRGFACCPRRTVKGAFAKLSPPNQGVWPDLSLTEDSDAYLDRYIQILLYIKVFIQILV